MKTPALSFSVRLTAVSLLFASMTAGTASLNAAPKGDDTGMKLLKAELPAGTRIAQANCEAISLAVSRATIAHRSAAPAIVSAALTGGVRKDLLRPEDRLSCECVTRILRASVDAAPKEASAVLDVAVALYPDCADSLSVMLDKVKTNVAAYNYQNGAEEPVAGINNVGSAGNFGSGIGPGFPGAPGFSGSGPSGGFALPPVVPPAVTTVRNQ